MIPVSQNVLQTPSRSHNSVASPVDDSASGGSTPLPEEERLSTSPMGSVLHRRPSRLYTGTERIRIPEELKFRYLGDQEEPGSSVQTSMSTSPAIGIKRSFTSTSPTAAAGDVIAKSASLPRSSSVLLTPRCQANGLSGRSPSDKAELRRVRSEILDASEKRKVRRPTILSPLKTAPIRGRSTSNATSRSNNGEISQTLALAHEAIAEERNEAVTRRRQEDNRMLTRAKQSKRSWRNWFYKAPDDAD